MGETAAWVDELAHGLVRVGTGGARECRWCLRIKKERGGFDRSGLSGIHMCDPLEVTRRGSLRLFLFYFFFKLKKRNKEARGMGVFAAEFS